MVHPKVQEEPQRTNVKLHAKQGNPTKVRKLQVTL
jgi:hypothetical protein